MLHSVTLDRSFSRQSATSRNSPRVPTAYGSEKDWLSAESGLEPNLALRRNIIQRLCHVMFHRPAVRAYLWTFLLFALSVTRTACTSASIARRHATVTLAWRRTLGSDFLQRSNGARGFHNATQQWPNLPSCIVCLSHCTQVHRVSVLLPLRAILRFPALLVPLHTPDFATPLNVLRAAFHVLLQRSRPLKLQLRPFP